MANKSRNFFASRKNKKFFSIIVIVAIIVSVIIWFVATRKQSSVIQQPTTQPIVTLNKIIKEKAGKKFSHVVVEYKKTASADKKIIHDFVDEVIDDGRPEYDPQYDISYLSPKYLVVSICVKLAPCSETLFDLNKLQEVKLQFPVNAGNYAFYENEKYVAFVGAGRMVQPGISIEMIDGKKVYCLISEEDVFDVVVKNGIMSFTEEALAPNVVTTKRNVNIADFCKNK